MTGAGQHCKETGCGKVKQLGWQVGGRVVALLVNVVPNMHQQHNESNCTVSTSVEFAEMIR